MKGAATALAILAIVSGTSRVRAQQPRACEQKVTAIAATLDHDARRTRVWYWSWMAAGAGLIAGQATVAAVTTGDLRLEMTTGALTSVGIPLVLLVHPPEVLSDAPRVDARLDATAVGGRPGDPCVALPRARELLLHSANGEELATSWVAHALLAVFNVGVGLVLGAGYHDWAGGVKQLVGGEIVGEAQILTLPGVALKARGLGIEGTF